MATTVAGQVSLAISVPTLPVALLSLAAGKLVDSKPREPLPLSPLRGHEGRVSPDLDPNPVPCPDPDPIIDDCLEIYFHKPKLEP